MHLGLNDSEQVIEELLLSYLHMKPEATVLDTGLQYLHRQRAEGLSLMANMWTQSPLL